jgi:hypothetical protein
MSMTTRIKVSISITDWILYVRLNYFTAEPCGASLS